MSRWAIILVVVAIACDREPRPPIANADHAADCAAQVRDLRSYILAAYDPARPKIAVPFPTGDAARDRRIDELRVRSRELLKPVDPSKPVAPLSPDRQPGPLETELAPCAAARMQLSKVGATAPGERRETMAEIAEAVGTCHCNVDVPLLRAMFYLDARGPD